MRGLILALAVSLVVLVTAGEGRADDEEDSWPTGNNLLSWCESGDWQCEDFIDEYGMWFGDENCVPEAVSSAKSST